MTPKGWPPPAYPGVSPARALSYAQAHAPAVLGIPGRVGGSRVARPPFRTAGHPDRWSRSIDRDTGGAGVRGGHGHRGIFTSFASGVAAAVALGTAGWSLFTGAPLVFDTLSEHGLLSAVATALIMIGPGAYSVDARLFGWRELHVPDPDED